MKNSETTTNYLYSSKGLNNVLETLLSEQEEMGESQLFPASHIHSIMTQRGLNTPKSKGATTKHLNRVVKRGYAERACYYSPMATIHIGYRISHDRIDEVRAFLSR